ncbi:MAG: hypothetical protein ABSC60_12020 [Acidobacteriota bacterium]|jgi:hypothetical protein
MKKQRKSATILKPVIDEEAVLLFASEGSGPASELSTDRAPKAESIQPEIKKSSHNRVEKDMRQISLVISKSLYDRIAKEAARKNRTVEEHLKKHLTKRFQK